MNMYVVWHTQLLKRPQSVSISQKNEHTFSDLRFSVLENKIHHPAVNSEIKEKTIGFGPFGLNQMMYLFVTMASDLSFTLPINIYIQFKQSPLVNEALYT